MLIIMPINKRSHNKKFVTRESNNHHYKQKCHLIMIDKLTNYNIVKLSNCKLINKIIKINSLL